ncbi:MAG: ATP-binding cassette domain-containing protein [Gemmatimonadota bacterium]|nr:MAG: ATP-binding cassette domain-containing protein [Gemmatimonadota bacterium]
MKSVPTPLLSVRHLVKQYRATGGLLSRPAPLLAVSDVSFDLAYGESLGLVGESGSGKTTLARLILRLTEATAGSVRFDGIDVLDLDARSLRALRRRIQIVFQDPFGSLNPRMSVGAAVREPIEVHNIARGAAAVEKVTQLFQEVGLDPSYVDRYPHELSGGQRQRVGIARALSVEPDLLVLDEPVSALDVSVQAQVLNLLLDLRERRGLTYLFIAHDLAVVRHIAQRIIVMYAGRFVETAPAAQAYSEPLHPYTRSLLSAVPVPDPRGQRQRIVLKGDMPDPRHTPAGCVFHPRCPHLKKDDRCRTEVPLLREAAEGRKVACHWFEEPMTVPQSQAARHVN